LQPQRRIDQLGGVRFSRLSRGEAAHHHHISGSYLLGFAQESAWREDSRRVPNGEQVQRMGLLALSPIATH
jgi:hypothetical protein